MEAARGIHPFVGVGPEKVPLGLDQVGGQPGAATGVKISQGNHESRRREAQVRGHPHHVPEVGLPGHEFLPQG